MIDDLERQIESLEEEVILPKRFIIPGDTVSSSALDVARTMVRRAERKVHRLHHEEILKNENVPCFLNRLADLLFILARYEEAKATEFPTDT